MGVKQELQTNDPARIGPYRLGAVLGSGGMGRVYLGRSAGGREVAVKVIRAELAADPEFRIRFRREVAAARLVNGLYTAAVVDADTEGPVPWLATTFISAPSLADAVQQGGPLAPAALRGLAAGLAEGLSAIHAAGLVHRDLKPTNVLLAADGPRVIDFGIARATEAAPLTGTNVVIGSPGYLSPEQAEPARGIGPASDVFSLGTVLCFAATGRSPWGTGSTAALIFRVVHGEPDLTGVPDEVKPLIERCMAKLPQQRPTAANILAELGDPELVSGWDVRGRTERVPWLADSSQAARLGSAADGSPRWSGSTAAAVLAPDDTVGPGTPSGATAANAGQQDGAPRLSPYFSQVHAGARPRARRRRRLLTALATAAVMTAALVVAHVQLGPGNEGHSPADTGAVTPGPPALAGVYSGSQYGFSTPNSIAADGSRVWVLNGGNDSVTELDARTGAWMRTLKGAPYGISHAADDTAGITDDGTDVWVGSENSVTEVNAADGSLVRTLRVPASVNLYGWYASLVRAGGQLWGATPNTCRPYCNVATNTGLYASLIQFDAGNGSYVRTVPRKTAQSPIALAGDGTHVWLVGSDNNGHNPAAEDTAGSVTEFNAADGHQVWSVPLTVYSSQQVPTGDSIANADGHLWVANGKSLAELNAGNGKLIRVLSGRRYNFTRPSVIAVAGAYVFVAGLGGNSVTVINARTGALAYTLTAARCHLDSLAGISVAGNRVWLLNSPSGTPSSVVELTVGAG
jgi:hypothetical protein